MSEREGDIADAVDRARLVDRLDRLVRTRSENPPGEEAAAGRLAVEMCRELGGDVAVHEFAAGRPNVVARWESGPGPTLGYCSHLDVVPAGDPSLWDHDPFGADIADGRLHGRGACDAKGPIAAALEAVAALRDAGVELGGTLELELVSDEETMGFVGAARLVGDGVCRPDFAIVGEPTSLRVVHAQRGACWLELTTRGLAGHGSAPERGRSAIRHMAEIVLWLDETLPDVSHPVLGGPSINVGTIAGGEKVNIVPARCVIEIDRRLIPGETPESVVRGVRSAIELAKRRFPEIDADVEVSFCAQPFEIDERAPLVTTVAGATAAATGAEARLMGFRGASDARFFADADIDVVVCGPGDIALAHTAREHIDLGELEQAAVAYALAFARLLGPAG